ncbi:MAG: hypothetical protein KJ963_06590 [Bacteroidetes bacterium]|nr:hypothetical protein [Bacteroidota bacterium]MBU1422959.1 hypothetical protein [Bacteroidota bacterium]MBU2636735.1 hypothetical protein [Bacteroidota bacterium]
MQDIQKELFSLMKAEKKLNLSLQLYHFAKRLKKEALKKKYLNLDEEGIGKKGRDIFLYART